MTAISPPPAPSRSTGLERLAATLALAPLTILLARLLLTSDFYVSIWLEIADFPGTVAGVRGLTGLEPASFYTVLTILTQAVGTVLILVSRRWAWLGAVILGAFTLLGAVLAHAFWSAPPDQATEMLHGFLDRLGMIGGFMLVAYWSLATWRT